MPAIRPRFLPPSPPRRSSRPLAISGISPIVRTSDSHPTQSRSGTPVSPSVHVGAFLRFARPTPRERRRHRLVRAALCSRCRTCSARQVRGRFFCCQIGGRWGCGGGLAVRGDCTSSPPSPLPLPLPFKLLRRHHRARARGAARDVTRRGAVTTAIGTVAVIATGGRPIARRAATFFGGVVAAPRDAAQLRETEVAAG